jgi:hypothetical protein
MQVAWKWEALNPPVKYERKPRKKKRVVYYYDEDDEEEEEEYEKR